MRPTFTVDVHADIAASPSAVWARISNHADTHSWVQAARVRVLSPGTEEPNGVNAVREVAFPDRRLWFTIRERVLAFEAPRTFSYKVIHGMPGLRDHLGTLTIDPLANGKSRLIWHVDFEFPRLHPMRLLGGGFVKSFGAVLQAGVNELARQLL